MKAQDRADKIALAAKRAFDDASVAYGLIDGTPQPRHAGALAAVREAYRIDGVEDVLSSAIMTLALIGDNSFASERGDYVMVSPEAVHQLGLQDAVDRVRKAMAVTS